MHEMFGLVGKMLIRVRLFWYTAWFRESQTMEFITILLSADYCIFSWTMLISYEAVKIIVQKVSCGS